MTVEKPTLSYSYEEFAVATGLSLSSIKKAVAEGRLTPSYEKSKPLIRLKEGQRFVDSLPATSTRRAS